jgi:putative membrane protein
MRISSLAALLLLVAVGAANGADTRAPTERFLEQAAGRSLAGMELSDLALQRTERAAVRQLARRIVAEQAQAYETILGLATGAGIATAPPATLDLEQRGIKSRLASLQGADFDRAYVQALRTNESRDIALYRAYARDGRDPALKTWAADQLQTIRKRQQLIEAAALEIR